MRTLYLFILGTILVVSACERGQKKEDPALNSRKTEEKAFSMGSHQDSTYHTRSGKVFTVKTTSVGESLMDITIIGEGFEKSNDSIRIAKVDPLNRVFVLDLDGDGYQEIYLVTTSVGSGSYASIYAISSNRDLSYSQVSVQEIKEQDLKDEQRFAGYMGHDSIFVSDNKLKRKFPVYRDGDANCCPTGGYRILTYNLYPGEAAWQLKVD